MTFISVCDFTDTLYYIRQKGIASFLGRLRPGADDRVSETWKCIDRKASDWWIIPEVRTRWNRFITGDPKQSYQEHILETYYRERNDLHVLSIGSGGGTAEIRFGMNPGVSSVTGIDISEQIVDYSNQKAAKAGLRNVRFIHGDIRKMVPEGPEADIILFNSSLHHFRKPQEILKRLKPVLKKDGLLVLNEYTGPDRLQWTKEQLNEANRILKTLPSPFRKLRTGTGYKEQCGRPGLLRVMIADPSEAISSSILLREAGSLFLNIRMASLGGNILHVLLKDIAHNFLNENEETRSLLQHLFREEDRFLSGNVTPDFTFSIYKNS